MPDGALGDRCIQIQRGTPSSSNISPHHPFTETIWDNIGREREGRKIIWQRTFFLSFYNQTLSTYSPDNQTADLKWCGHKKVIDCQMWFGKPPQAKVRHSGHRPTWVSALDFVLIFNGLCMVCLKRTVQTKMGQQRCHDLFCLRHTRKILDYIDF